MWHRPLRKCLGSAQGFAGKEHAGAIVPLRSIMGVMGLCDSGFGECGSALTVAGAGWDWRFEALAAGTKPGSSRFPARAAGPGPEMAKLFASNGRGACVTRSSAAHKLRAYRECQE